MKLYLVLLFMCSTLFLSAPRRLEEPPFYLQTPSVDDFRKAFDGEFDAAKNRSLCEHFDVLLEMYEDPSSLSRIYIHPELRVVLDEFISLRDQVTAEADFDAYEEQSDFSALIIRGTVVLLHEPTGRSFSSEEFTLRFRV